LLEALGDFLLESIAGFGEGGIAGGGLLDQGLGGGGDLIGGVGCGAGGI
jgi:hypothetical protein